MTSSDTRAARQCYKCGRDIGPDETICEVCNHAGMATPSASQYHGTIVVAIIAGVVALAVWGSLSLRGVGPYAGSVLSTTAEPPDAISVVVRIENEGSKQGFASCQVTAVDAVGRPLRSRALTLGPISGGSSAEFRERIAGLAAPPDGVEIDCG